MNRAPGCLRGMARTVPPHPAPPTDPALARLAEKLAALPDDWTLLRDRRIGDGEADGAPVGFVLLHPVIGVALLDLVPAHRPAAAEALADLLAAERLTGIPIVTLSVAPAEIGALGERLGAAFAAAPPCAAADPSWTGRALSLLLCAADAPMAPLCPPSAPPLGGAVASRQELSPLPAVPAVATASIAERAPRSRLTVAARAMLLLSAIAAADAAAILVVERVEPAPASGAAMALATAPPVVPPAAIAQPGHPLSGTAAAVEAACAAAPLAPVPASAAAPPRAGTRHRAQVRRRVARHASDGNDPAQGRFYDSEDVWLSPSGVPRPGAPAIAGGGG